MQPPCVHANMNAMQGVVSSKIIEMVECRHQLEKLSFSNIVAQEIAQDHAYCTVKTMSCLKSDYVGIIVKTMCFSGRTEETEDRKISILSKLQMLNGADSLTNCGPHSS